jgi:SAM-dependent methyltransferase
MRTARLLKRYDLIPYLKRFNRLVRRVAAYGHKLQFDAEWRLAPTPEWFDHFIHQYWQWYAHRNPMSWERGIFGTVAMKPGCRILDLCCGGGFFAYHFFSSRAASVISVDFDPVAIAHAQKNFQAPNLTFLCADIRTDMPEGLFDNIAWDAAIEHFTPEETTAIMDNIKRRLTPDGVLSGYTLVEKATGKSLSHHEYEFKSKEELAGILKARFKNVLVFENISSDSLEERHNLYFYASDGQVPFSPDWPSAINLSSTQ